MPAPDLAPGFRLARGVCRLLRSWDFAPLCELVLASGLRVDVIALGPRGEVWIVECKSSRADFVSDRKWTGYLDWCDRFFWAVDAEFPTDLLPPEAGLIVADAWGAEIARMALDTPLPGARRKALSLRFARLAASRLATLADPTPGLGEPG
ncbi:MmcB family DNA repair protein [Amaricoccus sp.]|uniref:MmcB family DNA repair protein n=1 Tax=Amaricoccus sp. TaxID=1872485 RepID=UPI001B3D7507|nr:MmcB family DNA repair protein [Amaricoccus sp.]MBP7002593.1 MmcB family DNA repair protein [Amaricoccus sp.]